MPAARIQGRAASRELHRAGLRAGESAIDDAANQRRRASPSADTSPVDVAQALHVRANRHGRAGRFDEAIDDLVHAITIRRPLAQSDPDAHAVRLARSLHASSVWLAAAGRTDAALRDSVEAVTILRGGAQRGLPDADADLGRALNGLAATLIGIGRPAEGVEPAAEAVALRRAGLRADAADLEAELAGTLATLARALRDAGRAAEGMPALVEAEAIHRRLAKRDPAAGAAAHAIVIGELGLAEEASGRRDTALLHFRSAVERHRLADPDGAGAPRADALDHLVAALRRAGRPVEAAGHAAELVAVRRRRFDRGEPDGALRLARSIVTVAELQLAIGAADVAERAAAEALRLLDGIDDAVGDESPVDATAPDASSAGWRARITLRAEALAALRAALVREGREVEALRAAESAVDCRRELAAVDRAVDVPLAVALHDVAGRLAAVGRCLEAVERSEEATTLLRIAVVERRAGALEALPIVLADHATRLGEAGRLADGYEQIEEALGLLRDPRRAVRDDDAVLATALRIRSERLRALGREEAAHTAADAALAMLRPVDADPRALRDGVRVPPRAGPGRPVT